MNVKWYYRQSEVPDSVYQHLVQDRNNENGETAFFFFFFFLFDTLKHTQRVNTHTCLSLWAHKEPNVSSILEGEPIRALLAVPTVTSVKSGSGAVEC